MDIAVYGLIGYEKALLVYEENRAFLEERFPAFWIRDFLAKREEIPDCDGLFTRGQGLAVAIREGGLYGALWQMCEVLGTGCEIDIKKVPLLQEVVEISECFGLDPYEVPSHGAFVVAGEDLAGKGIDGMYVIGCTKEAKERVLLLGWDEKKKERRRRYLTPLKRQKKDMAEQSAATGKNKER